VVAKKLCTDAIHILADENWIVPLGEIHFSLLVSPKFTGWKLNSLNQLDLTGLKQR
jgi:oligopeptide transport system substrate-binding protein